MQTLRFRELGLWQKIIQRIRRRLLLPGENWRDKKHGECSNFNNGNCLIMPSLFKGRNLDPKGPACPHFKAKNNPKNNI
jgi:hypothetical protein